MNSQLIPLSEDKNFLEVIGLIKGATTAHFKYLQTASTKFTNEENISRLNSLIMELKNSRNEKNQTIPGSFFEITGMKPDEFSVFTNEIKKRINTLKTIFPEIFNLKKYDLLSRLFDAIRMSSMANSLPPGTPTSVGTTKEEDDKRACYLWCQALFALQLVLPYVALMSALVGCILTGPFWPVCAAIAWATYALAVYHINKDSEDCVEECGG